jgi:hypothetical protein
MVSSDEFKKALRAGKLSEAFVMAMSQAPELRITTWIASSRKNLSQSSTSTTTPISNQVQADSYLRSRINLVEGSIDNEISEEFLGNRFYQEVQQLHLQQVVEAHQTIQQNLETLQNIFLLLANLQKQPLNGNYKQLRCFKVENNPFSSEKQIRKANSPVSQELTSGNNLLGTNNSTDLSANHINSHKNLEDTKLAQQNHSIREDIQVDSHIFSLDELESDNEDWSDWLTEEDEEFEGDLLDLASLDLDESTTWEEWEESESKISHSH